MFTYACDFSQRAVEFSHEKYVTDRCKAFVCDITTDQLTDNIPENSIDLISAIFVFSALPPEKMESAVENLTHVLKPNGKVLIRDYGLYDAAQLRFKPGSKLQDNLYARQDGTLAYYFSTEKISELFCKSNRFKQLENKYVHKKTTNVKRNLDVDRIFVQAKFEFLG
ncbi:Methyltransferase-like protein 6 [Smittium culicis]|uniref:Methyltransferase-like protein 6 n=1 Tax=Smittium culicis TaxID=133412 RepID=A0A1R1XDQ2_9FUNG|nr:Methyltransferase-like protein 6 [Smittium culicis]